MTRSFLFVPGSSERKLAKASGSAADALIVDLEDSVTAEARPKARQLTADFLSDEHAQEIWVRINPLQTIDALPDLRAVIPAQPTGVVLPKPANAHDLQQLAMLIDVLEVENEMSVGVTAVLPIVTETPAALFRLGEYESATSRLRAMTWGAEDLGSCLGAHGTRDDNGRWLPPYELARSLTLFAAHAAGVAAVDTVFTDFRDKRGLEQYATAARRDGFSGMLAIHPDQVDIINDAFSPSTDEVAQAEAIVKLFADHPGEGAIGLDGKMLDRPHLRQAQQVLALQSRIDRNER